MSSGPRLRGAHGAHTLRRVARTRKAPDWPVRRDVAGTRMWWMDLTATGLKAPVLSGPSCSVWPALTTPLTRVPATTVPTPGTLKYWSMRNSTRPSVCADQHLRAGRRLTKLWSMSICSPVTLDTLKMGATKPSRNDWQG